MRLILWWFGWALLIFLVVNLWFTGNCNCARYRGSDTPRSKICCLPWLAFGVLLVVMLW